MGAIEQKKDEQRAKWQQAEAIWRQLTEANPRDGNAWRQLAVALIQRGAAAEAIACFDRALALDAQDLIALVNKGAVLRRLGDHAEAAECFARAVKVAPENAEALNGLGNCYHRAGKIEEAIAALNKAASIKPDMPEIQKNLGLALLDKADFRGAEQCFRKGMALGDAACAFDLANALFLDGQFDDACTAYEGRLLTSVEYRSRDKLGIPWWQGESLSGKTLLVWGEQAVGEEVMFASLIPSLPELGKLVIAVEARMMPVFKRSFPNAEIITRQKGVHEAVARRDDIDAQVMMGSLLQWLKPARTAYLKADTAQVAELRRRYGAGKKIGISWVSSNALTGHQRSMNLEDWLPILRTDAQFVSLQYGDHAQELDELKRKHGIEVVQDSIDPLKDMDGFCAQVAAMDLVIICANSTAHVAGAQGVPVWVMTPFVPSWRWFMRREDSLWYPQAKLFRQKNWGRWEGVIASVAAELKE